MKIPNKLYLIMDRNLRQSIARPFIKENGICHVRGAPYHPATNGLAERLVKSYKRALKADQTSTVFLHNIHWTGIYWLTVRSTHGDRSESATANVCMKLENHAEVNLVKPDVRKTAKNSWYRRRIGRTDHLRSVKVLWIRIAVKGQNGYLVRFTDKPNQLQCLMMLPRRLKYDVETTRQPTATNLEQRRRQETDTTETEAIIN